MRTFFSVMSIPLVVALAACFAKHGPVRATRLPRQEFRDAPSLDAPDYLE